MDALHRFSLAGPGKVHLRILETTDLHAQVLGYDYHADRPDAGVGLAGVARLVAGARAGAANALLFDNGDFLQGTPLGDYIALERGVGPGAPHPVIAAMNALGYDGATPGNHDLDYGLDYLQDCLREARFPVICANLTDAQVSKGPQAGGTVLPPWALLDRRVRDGAGALHPIRIGLIGLLPPQTAIWNRWHLAGRAGTRDIVETAQALVPAIRAAGADIVVALCHSGIGPAEHSPGMENAALPLARVPGIDALLTGHSHLVFPAPGFAGQAGVDADRGTICGKPAVMAGFRGSHVGQIDLLLGHEDGRWRVLDHHSAARPVTQATRGRAQGGAPAAASPVIAVARADHEGTLRHIRRSIGRSEIALNSFFALVADSPSVRLVAEAQAAHVAARLAGGPLAGLPIVSAAAPFKTGGRGGPSNYTDIAPGDLTIGHVSDLYPFPNTVCALRLTGAQIATWLERSAAIFQRIAPGSVDAPLLAPECPGYNFDTIHGLTYYIDLSQPARFDPDGRPGASGARRITGLCHGGRPVRPDQQFILATNGYRGAGGGDFPGAKAGTIVLDGPETVRDAILAHLGARGPVTAPRDPAWRFRPMPGTSALFDSSPLACRDLDGPGGIAIEPAGRGARGFARFRLRL